LNELRDAFVFSVEAGRQLKLAVRFLLVGVVLLEKHPCGRATF